MLEPSGVGSGGFTGNFGKAIVANRPSAMITDATPVVTLLAEIIAAAAASPAV